MLICVAWLICGELAPIADDRPAQKCFREAVRLDPKFALGWALLSWFDAASYPATFSSTNARPPRRGAAGSRNRTHPSAPISARPYWPGAGPITLA